MRKKQVFDTEVAALAELGKFNDKFRVYRVNTLYIIALSPRDAMGQCGELLGLTVSLCKPRPVTDEKSLADFAASLPPAKRAELIEVLDHMLGNPCVSS